jgi:O-methyltransferase involved in polyketide biosynthesis
LQGVSETLLITLYSRALETQSPDGCLHDPRAVEMVSRIDCDFSRLRMHGHDQAALVTRVGEFDRFAREFLARYPQSRVVHLGCGLDTRFDRVDNGQVEWFDLDLPAVIALRRRLLGEAPRCQMLACSALDERWMQELSALPPRPTLFISEGVLPYFTEAQVQGLLRNLASYFPGAELVCDGHTPFVIWADNLHLAVNRISARMQWGLKDPHDVETWGAGFTLLESWYYFDSPRPSMAAYRWMGRIPLMGKSAGIFHYRLGKENF